MPDIELWNAAMQGNEDAFSALFQRHYSFLYQFGLKLCADTTTLEDAIQELFTELWQKKQGTEVASVRAYLVQALKYKLYKVYRTKKQQNTATKADELFELSPETFLIKRQEDAARTKKILDTLNALPPRQKEIIYLKIYKELSYEEISIAMNLNYQVVRNLLCQALKTFRKMGNI